MSTLLDVHDLQVSYLRPKGRQVVALQGVNFTLKAGETLGVIGESGSGKSTLALSLLSLLPANGRIRDGNIRFAGNDVLRMDARNLQKLRGERIALIFQEPGVALHPTMRIRQQVGEILRAHFALEGKKRKERTREILAEVFGAEAARISSSYPHELSGGQRQRAMIAQAIACRPAIIVADEATASLDTVTQREILSLFQRLRNELGLAIIFITHNPALLNDFADRILVLYGGKVAELGRTKDVLSSPLHPYAKLLLGCSPSISTNRQSAASRLPVIPGEAPDSSKCERGCCFAPRCPEKMLICDERAPARIVQENHHEVFCFLHGG